MIFRPATVNDAAAISSLIYTLGQSFVVNSDGSGADRFWASVSTEAEASYIQSTRYQFTVAEAGNSLAGVIGVRDTTHLFHLFVATDHQRKGLAKMLWQHVLGNLQARAYLGPVTVNSSLSAQPVYERFGFLPSGSVTHADGIAFIPMSLNIANGQA
ncbi:MAG: GNAT family N-acetyltransferase [Burkholderiales bacterium]